MFLEILCGDFTTKCGRLKKFCFVFNFCFLPERKGMEIIETQEHKATVKGDEKEVCFGKGKDEGLEKLEETHIKSLRGGCQR